MVIEQFCIFIAVVVTQIYTGEISDVEIHTHNSNVNFLVLILYYNFINCKPSGETG